MDFRPVLRSVAGKVVGVKPVGSALRRAIQSGRPIPWVRLPVPSEPFDVSVVGATKPVRFTPAVDHPDVRALYWRGLPAFEPETLSVYLAYARTADRIIDVGANRGVFSLVAAVANPSAQISAFEPLPRVRAVLEQNISLTGAESQVSVYDVALSNATGTAQFVDPDHGLPTSARLVEAQYSKPATGEMIDVQTARFDDWNTGDASEAAAIDLVKIDVEGAEHLVLAGMERTIARDQPAVLFECLPDGPVAELRAIIEHHGYAVFRLTDAGPVPGALEPDAARQARNWLMLPAGVAPLPPATL